MTSNDESSKGFLQRWSRKKLDAEQREADAPKADEATAPERIEPATRDAPPAAAATPEFDLSSLPSLDSITAGTDIRAFLVRGVPVEIARAALRRAWTAETTIRDFVGLAENAGDFNDPASMPGFGPLEPGYDIERAVAQMFGEVEKLTCEASATEEPATAPPAHLIERSALPEACGHVRVADVDVDSTPQMTPNEGPKTSDSGLVQRDSATASHKDAAEITDEHKPRRNHGGALPQ